MEELDAPTPDGVQHLLARACSDAEAVLDELLRYVAVTLAHPNGVLIIDETGFLKKGIESTGVGLSEARMNALAPHALPRALPHFGSGTG